MANKLYIICRKCGSDSVDIHIDDECPDDPTGFVTFRCTECAELTSIGEWAEFNNRKVVDNRERQKPTNK